MFIFPAFVRRVPTAVGLTRRPSVVRDFWSSCRRYPSPWQLVDSNSAMPSTANIMANAFRHINRELRSFDQEVERIFELFGRRQVSGMFRPWYENTGKEYELPIEVTDNDGGRRLALKVDVSQFKPDEVKVTLRDNILTIQAMHEETSEDGGRVFRDYVKQYSLPDDVVAESIRSLLGEDGTLTVEARLPPQAINEATSAKSKEIPIEQQRGSSSVNEPAKD